MERTLSHQNSSMGPSRLPNRVIQSGSYDMPDLQLRMSKKIAQLTSVIHQLHTKSEDHEMDLQDMSEAYETEIEQMLRDAASKINTFKNQLEGVRDDTRFKEAVITLEERYRKETEESLAEIAIYKQRMAERETAIQNAAKKQMMDLEVRFEGLGTKLEAAAQELAQVKHQATEHEAKLKKQIEKAQEETEEAIQAGNHRYNSMLHESMNKQDDLSRKMDSLKLEIAGKVGEVRDLENQMNLLRKDSEESQGRQHKSWEDERRATEKQKEQEEKMWQDRLQQSMKQAEEHRLATLAANRKLGAVQAELTETSDKLILETKRSEQLSSSVSDIQKDLQSMTTARDEKEGELEQERTTCADLNHQLAEFASRHQNDLKAAGDEEEKLATQVLQLTAELQKARKAIKAAEHANVKALQEIQKSASSLESRRSELQDVEEQIRQLQSALNSEVKGRSEDKTAAAAALQQQLAAKAKELQKAAQQLAVADQQYKSLQEAGQKQSAHAHAAALAEAAERLSQTQQAHVQEVKSIQEGHAKLMNIHSQKHEEEMKALQKVKSKELAAAAKAADKVLKHHKQRAAEELQATEASWSAMASDLQEQVTDMQQRTRTLECECDDLRKQLEGANDVTARKMKEAEGKHDELTTEMSELQQQHFDLQRQLHDVTTEKQRLLDTIAKAQSEASSEEGSLRQTISDLTSAREQEKKEAQQLLDEQRAELMAHWQCKLDRAVSDALSAADSAHQHSLHAREGDIQSSLREQHKATVTELNSEHAAELTKLQESLEFQHQASLQALQVELNHKLEDAKSRALEDLEKARQCSASELNALREAAKQDTSAAEQQHADKLAAREQEHTEEISKLRADHVGAVERFESESQKSAKEAAQLFLQEKQRTAAGIRKLQDAQRESEAAAERTQGGLKRKLDQIQERLELTIGERDKLSSDLTALQAALAKKVLEMNDAMHAATTNQQEEVSSLKSCHKRQTEENDTTHCRRIAALKATLEDVRAEAEEKYDNLSQAYGELKLAWDNRGAREVDVERINHLTQMINERDEQIQGFERKYSELRNEMLLREDNYNNHFANGGVGKQVLGVDRALSSGEDVASWMIKRKSSNAQSTLQRTSSGARHGGPRPSRAQ